MENDIKKFNEINDISEEQKDFQPITLERCREEIVRLLGEDGHDTDTSSEEIDKLAEQIMREFNWTFALLERRIFGWKKNK
jgi:hypothetical protein